MRNPDCPHYLICLDLAAHVNEVFTCCGCPDERTHRPAPITEGEVHGVLSLLAVVFGRHPDVLRAELYDPRPWAAILPGEIIG
jgi:hypothetical protein